MVTSVFLVLAIVTFETRIGFDELDYQRYVAKNNPEDIAEFHNHGITDALDATIRDPVVRRYLAGFFYPDDPIPLRTELKSEIQAQLALGRWPSWFLPLRLGPSLQSFEPKVIRSSLGAVFRTGSLVGPRESTLREILFALGRTYCETVGAEYMHITETAEKRWIQLASL